ncbi:hypothetical protein SFA35_16790 [Pseudomonas sp. HR96]|uniref:hypothetical protein n=1 Tax=Pseudomonas sp. HR96 TaxID=1027966 RepID=UPI002A758765|nr:hypothetical protein [Pseudomonas sp. HR96]WPO98296.1 hypothetical protein SFA35_16790 [Pseudomonas sp. HR96]
MISRFLRVIVIVLATTVYVVLSIALYLGSRDVEGFGGISDFLRYQVLVAGFMPWVTWVLLAVFWRSNNNLVALFLAFMVIVWHYCFFAVSAHAEAVSYWMAQFLEFVIFITFFISLRKMIIKQR